MEKTSEDYYNIIDQAATLARPLFTLYGWTYGEKNIPTKNELGDAITRLVDDVLDQSKGSDFDGHSEVSSGRFSVSYREFEDEKNLSIRLELSEHSDFKEFK